MPLGEAVARASHAAHGTHWLIDCHGVASARLADAALLEAMLCEAAADAGARRLFQHFHRFDSTPHAAADVAAAGEAGVTGVVLLAESHMTIHTWPEEGFAAIDLFLCGDTRPERALARIERALEPERIVTLRQRRGQKRDRTAAAG